MAGRDPTELVVSAQQVFHRPTGACHTTTTSSLPAGYRAVLLPDPDLVSVVVCASAERAGEGSEWSHSREGLTHLGGTSGVGSGSSGPPCGWTIEPYGEVASGDDACQDADIGVRVDSVGSRGVWG